MIELGLSIILCLIASPDERPPGKGKGRGPDTKLRIDQEDFHFLLERHAKIRRTVTKTANGVETLTESDVPEVAARIKKHVAAMKQRMESGNGLRWWDPLFAALFKEHAKIVMVVRETAKGVAVTETSDDPRVIQLIQAHANTVSLFSKHGFEEAEKSHPVPKNTSAATTSSSLRYPIVPKIGGVFFDTSLIDPPVAGTKALFDITGVGKPEEILPGLERVARLLNLAAAAGVKTNEIKIAVVLHGDAIRAAFRNKVYLEKHGVANPHADLLPLLQKHGVEVAVCAQALARSGITRSQLVEGIPVAASAMTFTLKRQQQGYGVLVFR